MRLLSTLYVRDHRSRVALQKGALMVSREGAPKVRVPLESLEGVVILGAGHITTDALAACVERNIRVASLRRGGQVRFVVGGPTSGNVHLRLGQYEAATTPGRTAALARWFVAGKLANCRRLLARWSWDAPEPERSVLRRQHEAMGTRLQALAGVEDTDRIRGIEGDAARGYFRGLAARLSGDRHGMFFLGRNRRPPRDPVNATLSFLYGLVLAEVVGALESVGLDPQIGFLHGARPGRPALALDMLEELRPSLADRFGVAAMAKRRIRQEHFQSTAGGACYLTDVGRSVILEAYEAHRGEDLTHRLLDRQIPRWTLPNVQATLLARHLRGDLAAYPPFVMDA